MTTDCACSQTDTPCNVNFVPEPETQKLEDSNKILYPAAKTKSERHFAQRNKHYHRKVLVGSHLNAGHTLGYS